MIAAEELDMDMSQLSIVQADTDVTPNTGREGREQHDLGRRRARRSRGRGLGASDAARRWPQRSSAFPSSSLTREQGRRLRRRQVRHLRSVDRREALQRHDAGELRHASTPTGSSATRGAAAGDAPAKPVSQYKVIGTNPPRIDIPGIVTGTATYIQNVRVPGMLHGRVVRPRGQRVYGSGAPIVSVDESSIKHIPNVRVVRKGELPRRRGAARVRRDPGGSPVEGEVGRPAGSAPGQRQRVRGDAGARQRRQVDHSSTASTASQDVGNVDAALASAAHVVSRSYGWPTNVAHADRPAVLGRRRDAAGGADLHRHPGCLHETRAVAPGARSARRARCA